MNFVEALARIEELTANRDAWSVRTEQYMLAATELHKLFDKYADSIVQLAKVAAEMRSSVGVHEGLAYRTHNELLVESIQSYDKLLKGERYVRI